MFGRSLVCLLLLAVTQLSVARDFENNYAVYGAGGDSCGMYLKSMKKGGKQLDYFIDWTVGYLAAFNVIMPSTYDVLGETDFPAAQMWLERHCKRYPKRAVYQCSDQVDRCALPHALSIKLERKTREEEV